jgi:hypothetical protein
MSCPAATLHDMFLRDLFLRRDFSLLHVVAVIFLLEFLGNIFSGGTYGMVFLALWLVAYGLINTVSYR